MRKCDISDVQIQVLHKNGKTQICHRTCKLSGANKQLSW